MKIIRRSVSVIRSPYRSLTLLTLVCLLAVPAAFETDYLVRAG